MGSKEAKKNNALVDQERVRAAGEHQQAMGYLNPERMAEKGWADQARDKIFGGYEKFASGEGLAGIPGAGGGGGGGLGMYTPESIKLTGTLEDAKNRYRTWADTGGLTEGDKGLLRSHGQAPISGFFGGLQRRMDQQRQATQAGNVGFGSSLERMARAQSREASNVALGTEKDILDRTLAGKQWGLTGYTGIGGTEQDIDIRNVEERNAAQQRNLAASASNAAAGSADAKWRAGMQMDALDQMARFYGQTPGELSRYDDLLMAERGMASNQFQQSNQQRMNYNPNISAWDRVGQIANMAGGAVGAMMGNPAALANIGGMFGRGGQPSNVPPAPAFGSGIPYQGNTGITGGMIPNAPGTTPIGAVTQNPGVDDYYRRILGNY